MLRSKHNWLFYAQPCFQQAKSTTGAPVINFGLWKKLLDFLIGLKKELYLLFQFEPLQRGWQ